MSNWLNWFATCLAAIFPVFVCGSSLARSVVIGPALFRAIDLQRVIGNERLSALAANFRSFCCCHVDFVVFVPMLPATKNWASPPDSEGLAAVFACPVHSRHFFGRQCKRSLQNDAFKQIFSSAHCTFAFNPIYRSYLPLISAAITSLIKRRWGKDWECIS